MRVAATEITARGNAVGFTAAGETIVAGKRPGAWYVQVEGQYGANLADARCRSFGTRREAAEYATTLVDDEQTEAKAWWL